MTMVDNSLAAVHWDGRGWFAKAGILVGLMTLAVAARADDSLTPRWYTPVQVDQGRKLYQEHCAVCHGADAEGAENWQQRDAMGFYPPPPLNGSGHATMHPLQRLLAQIDQGGGAMGGTMPAFSDILTQSEEKAALAYVQSLWPDAVYDKWQSGEMQQAAGAMSHSPAH